MIINVFDHDEMLKSPRISRRRVWSVELIEFPTAITPFLSLRCRVLCKNSTYVPEEHTQLLLPKSTTQIYIQSPGTTSHFGWAVLSQLVFALENLGKFVRVLDHHIGYSHAGIQHGSYSKTVAGIYSPGGALIGIRFHSGKHWEGNTGMGYWWILPHLMQKCLLYKGIPTLFTSCFGDCEGEQNILGQKDGATNSLAQGISFSKSLMNTSQTAMSSAIHR